MGMRTKKQAYQSRDNSIKKSNEISMAEMNYGLGLNQTQLLAYAIYSTQQDGKTEFRKSDFQKYFGINQYNTKYAYQDAKKIMDLQVSVKNLEHDYFRFTNVFVDMVYDKGKFTFKWNETMIPHILDIKERYVVTDLKITSNFKSSFSWRLYEYLKAHYGYYHKSLSKEEIFILFNVENRKTYWKNIGEFKRGVLKVAVNEVNKYTELEVWYQEQKKGRSVVGFDIYWASGEVIQQATDKQMQYIKNSIESVESNELNYRDLNDERQRRIASEAIDFIKSQKSYMDNSVYIDVQKADQIIGEIDFYIKSLNHLIRLNTPSKRDTSFYYDWTEDIN